ncbi:MAG: hypothetical protein ACU88J_10665 [Gammaproteobacteria bacterium]
MNIDYNVGYFGDERLKKRCGIIRMDVLPENAVLSVIRGESGD